MTKIEPQPFDGDAVAAPHPRIRARRIEVQRDEGRRRLRVFLAGVAAIGSAAGIFGLTRSPLLDVDHVEVRGATNTTAAQVLDASGVAGGPPIVDVDLPAIERSVETLPWVESATATRHFPNRVTVEVRERVPLAAVGSPASRWSLVDTDGRVLARLDAPPAGLIRVETEAPVPAPGHRVRADAAEALRLVDMLPPVLSPRISAVSVEGPQLDAVLDDRIAVDIDAGDLEDKVIALATLVQRAELARVRTIDVRVPTAPVLTRG